MFPAIKIAFTEQNFSQGLKKLSGNCGAYSFNLNMNAQNIYQHASIKF